MNMGKKNARRIGAGSRGGSTRVLRGNPFHNLSLIPRRRSDCSFLPTGPALTGARPHTWYFFFLGEG